MKQLLLGLVTIFSLQAVFADKLLMLDGSQESIEARKDLISTAESEIRAQYYIIENDDIANAGIAILRDVAIKKPHVRIRIIVDALNNLMLRETMAAFMSDDQGNPLPNVQIREYNNFKIYAPWRYNRRMHDKALIVDNDALISGGRNIANGYFGKKNDEVPTHSILEDTDVLVMQSPAVREAAYYFDNLWNSKFVKQVGLGKFSFSRLKPGACESKKQFYSKNNSGHDEYESCEYFRKRNEVLVGKQRAELIHLAVTNKSNLSKSQAINKWLRDKDTIEVASIDYVYDNPVGQKSSLKKPKAVDDNIAKQLYRAIRTARESVVIVTPYLIITPEQEELFKELRARNVRVRIFTNGANSNDVPVAHVGYLNTRELALKHGAQIWEYNGPDSLHAKMVLIDRTQMYVGSFNWDFRSQNLNRENGIIATIDPNSPVNINETDIYAKIGRIYMRSTLLGNTKRLNHEVGEDGEYDDDDIANLAKEIRRGNKNILFWQIVYPLIKKQL